MVYVVVMLIMGGVGAAVGSNKGRPGLGFILGALLSLVGIVIIALMDPTPEARATSATPHLPVADRLSRLDQLKASGGLTDAEYQSERARILGAL